jgi:hypothetical protein
MSKVMYNLNEVQDKITQGQRLLLAGEEALLKQLPKGQWIAGTIPYFMAENGGTFSQDLIFTTELPAYIKNVSIQKYTRDSLASVNRDSYPNGFSVMIIPSSSPTHFSFALNAAQYEGFATTQLIGWIAGVELNQLGKITPKVFFGPCQEVIEDGAVVMHVELPAHKYAEMNILNLFHPGDGDAIYFLEDGFSAGEAVINGVSRNFADYLAENNIDTRLPLVADYCGAMINTSFQGIDKTARRVDFYAPVFKGIQYKLAAPVGDYVAGFEKLMPKSNQNLIVFSCNCILNYLYSELEGKQTGGVTGPITFGEVAYQLLNQTLAYVLIQDLKQA